ncbi:MAG: SAM-dependent methyltransferase [Serpentinimonas sp.]|nr:SAM-dependent methyltransferase [Serpentinimonas sp.]
MINDSFTEPSAAQLAGIIRQQVQAAGGWLPFDRFMALALYQPGLGYYAHAGRKFGAMPASGSDFVTAPELTPAFGRTLARQVAQALQASGTDEVWEFGGGSGALAQQVLQQLQADGVALARYTLVELSAELRGRQQQRLAAFAPRVAWADALPPQMQGVILGNEVLDAMPVQLLCRRSGVWHERGVGLADAPSAAGASAFAWVDRTTALRPPLDIPGAHDYLCEIHPQAEAFIATLAERWQRGVAFFIDYGFPEAEYYHPQRSGGTLMCHRAHRADADPLADVGLKDITAHVNFTGIALAAQQGGLQVLGYTSQGRFLINAGLFDGAADWPLAERAAAARLVNEHEMGELFKVLALAPTALQPGWLPSGLLAGDRTHTL